MEKKLFFNIVAIIALSFFTLSCDFFTSSDKTSELKQTVAPTVMNVETLLAKASELVGQEIVLEGVCTHTCSHGAKKMFLIGDSLSIRVESGKLGKFDTKCINSIVNVTGTLIEERIDESYLQEWEAKVAITEKEEHGDDEEGCDAEKDARQEKDNSTKERIATFRDKIAKEKADTGNDYLSFYHVEAISYEIK